MILKIIFLSLMVLFIAFLFFEKYYHKKIRAKIPLVIHVNGTRGKSTTARLIDAGLRAAGYQVFTKTTGTKPLIINTNNEQIELRRFGNGKVIEQLKILRKAYQEKADVLVIECMAITKELIALTENKMLKSNIALITNVYLDHTDTMGESLIEIAESLALVTPKNGDLIISDNDYQEIFKKAALKNNTNFHVSKAYQGENVFETSLENVSNALMVAEILNIDKEVFIKGMKSYHKDPGAYSVFKMGETTIYNGFSINDPDSTLQKYNEIKETMIKEELTLLLNTRNDRQFRTNQFIEMIKVIKPKKVFLTGSSINYVIRALKKANIEAVKYHSITDLHSEKDVFLIGNYGGNGEKILTEIKLKGEQQ